MDWNKRVIKGQVIQEDDKRDYTEETHRDLLETVNQKNFYFPADAPVLDQSYYPFCVGFATAGIVNGFNLWEWRQNGVQTIDVPLLDGWKFQKRYLIPRELPDKGRSILSAGVQAKEEGLIDSYVKLKDRLPQDVEDALDNGHLVSISIYDGDWNLPANGQFIKIRKGASAGHNIFVYEATTFRGVKAFKCRNSRGEWYGDKGDFYIRYDEFPDIVREARVFINHIDTDYNKQRMYMAMRDAGTDMSFYRQFGNNREKSTMQAMKSFYRIGFGEDQLAPYKIDNQKFKDLIDEFQ